LNSVCSPRVFMVLLALAVAVAAPANAQQNWHAKVGAETPDMARQALAFLPDELGKLGRDETFFVVPRKSDLRIPTDIAGITPGRFKPDRRDRNLAAAFGPFCSDVRMRIRGRGRRTRAKARSVKKRSNVQRSAVKDGKLHVYVGNQLAGDPAPNTPKELTVTYSTDQNGFILGKVVPEGQTLDLP
jgi:hypothetical protein